MTTPLHRAHRLLSGVLLAALLACQPGAGAGSGTNGNEAPAAVAAPASTSPATATKTTTGSAGYDPAADPAADLAAAVLVAQEEGKRILLEVGGEWCKWCHILEEFIHETPAVERALTEHFIVVKVNFSDENENEAFLADYPEISGYPHIFVLEADGSLLHSQNTGELEAEGGYDEAAVLAFLDTWEPTAT